MSKLRQFVKIVLEEKQSKLSADSISVKEIPSIYARLLGYDIGPAIGAGAKSIVYEARKISTGEPVIMKFSASKDEWKGYDVAREARRMLPDDLAKHIVRVDLADIAQRIPELQSSIEGLRGSPVGAVSVIITEKLEPLGRELARKLLRPQMHFTSYEEIKEAVKTAINKLYTELIDDSTILPELHQKDRITVIRNALSKLAKDKDSFIEAAYNYKRDTSGAVDSPAARESDPIFSDVRRWVDKSILKDLRQIGITAKKFTDLLYVEFTRVRRDIDRESKRQRDVHMSSPAAEKFKTLALELEKLGIAYHDVHEDNVMIRPGTGDLVIADAGQFIFSW